MSIMKKTLLAGLAVVTFASAGTVVTTTPADAGNGKQGYTHHKYCVYKKVWALDSYGNRYLKKIKVCH